MRILVTGAANPFGAAVAEALVKAGHTVRAFGVAVGDDPFHGADGIELFPGDIASGGSVEPATSECQVFVHCANLDALGKDKQANAVHIEAGTRYARYAAERELVTQFIALFPTTSAGGMGTALKQAEAHVLATRKLVPHFLLHVVTPDDAVRQVLAALGRLPQIAT